VIPMELSVNSRQPSGEPGAGKSRLLYEFRQALADRKVSYLEGRCLSYGSSIPYVPILDIVRQNFAITHGDAADAITAKVVAGMEEVGLDADEWLPLLLLFLGVRQGTERVAALTPETIKARTFEMLRQLSLSGSRRRALIFGLEDLHWVDKISEEYLASLAESLSGAPILLLSTYRPGYRPPWMEKSFATQISLRPLSSADSLRVVRSASEGHMVSETLAEAIVEKAGGNPLFLEELARVVSEQPLGLQSFSMPDTVQGVLQARIDRLANAPKRLLRTASVIGREVPLKLLRVVWEVPGSLDVHLLDLKRQEFLFERSTAGEQIYIFKHALTQEVAHDSLLTLARQALHETTARAIEATYEDHLEEHYERLAHHYSQTTNNDKAFKYLWLANQKAAKANAMQEAMTYFERAMGTLDKMPDTEANRQQRISLILDQWIVFWLLFRVPAFYDLLTRYRDTVNKLGDPGLLGRFQFYFGHCQWVFGSFDQAAQTALNAARLSEEASLDVYAGAAYNLLQFTHLFLGNFDQAIALEEPALQRLRGHLISSFAIRNYAWSFAAASWAYSSMGRFSEALTQAQSEISVAEEYHDNSLAAFAYWIAGIAYIYKSDFAKAIEHCEIAVEKAPTLADKAWGQTFLAFAWCRSGQARKAADLLAPLVQAYEATQVVVAQVMAITLLGEAYWRSGQLDLAEWTLQKGLELANRIGAKFYMGCMRRLLGEVALERNPRQVAEPFAAPHFEAGISILRDIKAEIELAFAYAGYGRFHEQQGRVAEARAYFARALEIFERLGTLVEPDKVRAELAALPASS
jgi:tetratricopeptide (TPR) repeat protein